MHIFAFFKVYLMVRAHEISCPTSRDNQKMLSDNHKLLVTSPTGLPIYCIETNIVSFLKMTSINSVNRLNLPFSMGEAHPVYIYFLNFYDGISLSSWK